MAENGNVEENSDLENGYTENGDVSENEPCSDASDVAATENLNKNVDNVIENNDSSDGDNDNNDVINEPDKEDDIVAMDIAQSKRTRSDIEAQRELHKALLDEEESSEEEKRDSEQGTCSLSSRSAATPAQSTQFCAGTVSHFHTSVALHFFCFIFFTYQR